MRYPTSVRAIFRYLAAIVILMAVLLPLLEGMVSAQDEKPSNVRAFPNAPGMITIVWDHSGKDVYWFVLEQESPPAVNQMDRDKRAWSVLGLQPSRTYRYQICAVYAYHRKCSSEDGIGYVSVTTMPPERVGGGAPPPTTPSTPPPGPAPKALYSPVIRAWPNRVLAGSQAVVQLKWVNPVDATQFTLLKRMDWYRDGEYFNSSNFATGPEMGDTVKPNATHRYKLCVENAVNRICSAEIFASSTGVAASFESVNYPKRYIRHRNSLGELTPVTNNLDSQDIAFFLRPGLNGSAKSVSFESVNYPGSFLRHQGYRIKLQANDRSELFAKDATFVVRPGLRNLPDLASFEAVNFPGHFIRHQNFQLWIAKNDGSQLFQYDASFRQTDHYVGHLLPPAQLQPYSTARNAGQVLQRDNPAIGKIYSAPSQAGNVVALSPPPGIIEPAGPDAQYFGFRNIRARVSPPNSSPEFSSYVLQVANKSQGAVAQYGAQGFVGTQIVARQQLESGFIIPEESFRPWLGTWQVRARVFRAQGGRPDPTRDDPSAPWTDWRAFNVRASPVSTRTKAPIELQRR